MLERFIKSKTLAPFLEVLSKGESLKAFHLKQTPKALLTSLAATKTKKKILYITSFDKETRLLSDLPNFFEGDIFDFSAWETMPFENIEPSPDIVGERAKVLHQLTEKNKPQIILTNIASVLTHVLNKDDFKKLSVHLKVHQETSFSSLIEKLVAMGYMRVSVVNDKGEMAVRGGIIDIFPSSEPQPYRLEFFGDEIESIRSFDPIAQVSVEQEKEVLILPNKELELLKQKKSSQSLLSYFNDETIIVLDDPEKIEKKYRESLQLQEEESPFLEKWDDFLEEAELYQKIVFSTNDLNPKFFKDLQTFESPFVPIEEAFPAQSKLILENDETLLVSLPLTKGSDYKFYYVTQSEAEEKHLKEQLEESAESPVNVEFIRGSWTNGFAIREDKVAYISYPEITRRYSVKRKSQRRAYHSAPIEFMQLTVGDHVVHLQHGIAKYLGCEKRINHLGVESEFLMLKYDESATLYVPLEQSYLVSKYIGAKGEVPKLHTIGGKQWLRTKVQTERAITDYAAELLDLYAKRGLQKGNIYPEDSEDQKLFEKQFPYIETADQMKAIEALKEDMTTDKTMDRLICGDVGYGKTEVAMRAAFKAVVDGTKQVAVLVPTTVLALQHFETFSARMANFPVNIGVLSRFISVKEQKKTIEGLKNGSVDIVIGTHRVISNDIEFKDLGLVIIDEEQRFGVKAKEHLKKVKLGVDCLTLSATPIPRTLYMSMVGARDISLINSPPQDRVPIKTIIAEIEPKLIRQAIIRELARDGQVFIIHNRVATIYQFADKIKELVPEIQMLVGHGQMSSEELDQVFHSFKNKEANVLISTTIIESGIDIPLANTILIDRADRFGLADLYQLRGRVGRWNRRAYAYFLVPKNKELLEVAQKRMTALVESSGFGGGMKIALRDLEIRGAGEILGSAQSGQISAIGFHLYCKLLKRTILSMQGKAPKNIIETKMVFPIDARIPEEYIPDITLRMEIYQRIGEAYSFEAIEKIEKEIIDRFGAYPEPFRWLYHLSRAKIFAAANKFLSIEYKRKSLTVEKRTNGVLDKRKTQFVLHNDPKIFEEQLIEVLRLWR